jgi:hypothetical protein
MGAWNKLFSNKNIVSSSCTVKSADGVVRTIKPTIGTAGLSDDDFLEACRAGSATLGEQLKELNDRGEEKNKRRTIKPGDITGKEAADAAADIMGVSVPTPKPEKVTK